MIEGVPLNNNTDNKNNVLTDEKLTRALVIANNFTREANIYFRYGNQKNARIGDFQNLSEVFGLTLRAGLDEGGFTYNPATLIPAAIATGLRDNSESLAYDKQRRRDMVAQLRATLSLAAPSAPEPAQAPLRTQELVPA